MSVVSALVGAAFAGGELDSLHQPLLTLFPELESRAAPGGGGITLRHALTMAAGLDWNEGDAPSTDPTNHAERMVHSPDPAGFVLARPLAVEPGTVWDHNGGLPTVLGFAVARASGQSLGAFARERLFDPLGISDCEWAGPAAWSDLPELRWEGRREWAGVANPSSGLWLRARDLLRLARLYADGGVWQGHRVLEAEAVAAASDGSQGSHTDAVVVVDRAGNVAALTFTINTVNWARTGIFVDGVSISDAVLSNRTAASQAGAGNRVPNSLNPLLVLRDGAPVLAWSAIGAGVREATVQTLCAVLDFGLDPITAAEAPQVHLYATPFLTEVLEGTPDAPLHARIVIEGEFDDALLEALRARGQPVLELPAPRVAPIRGWGVTATVDPVTGGRTGAASRFSGGLGVAVPRR